MNTQLRRPLLLLALLCCATGLRAENDFGYRHGSGPDAYRSDTVTLGGELPSLPMRLSLDHFKTAGGSETRQTGVALDWRLSDAHSLGYRRSRTTDEVMRMNGDELSASLSLASWLSPKHPTRLALGLARFHYSAADPAGPRRGGLEQQRWHVGLEQDFGTSFSATLGADRYDHDPEPKDIALRLLRLPRNNAVAAFTLLAFPERGENLGLRWKSAPQAQLSLDLTRTRTVLAQQLRSVRFGLDYDLSKNLVLIAALSRSTSSRLDGPNDAVLQPGSEGKYFEAGLNWYW